MNRFNAPFITDGEPFNAHPLTGQPKAPEPARFTMTAKPDAVVEHAKALRHLSESMTGQRGGSDIVEAMHAIAFDLSRGRHHFDQPAMQSARKAVVAILKALSHAQQEAA